MLIFQIIIQNFFFRGHYPSNLRKLVLLIHIPPPSQRNNPPSQRNNPRSTPGGNISIISMINKSERAWIRMVKQNNAAAGQWLVRWAHSPS